MNAIIRKFFYFLPVGFRYGLRRLIYMPLDLFEKRHPLVPPKGLIFTGRGDYLRAGKEFFGHFLKLGDITPQSAILDIGSGIGRMAIPFTEFLSSKGRYEGFDIVKLGVDWCNKNISPKFPNFHFRLIPLRNELYNLKAKDTASQLAFPYESQSFDFAFLSSVFTHMMPDDFENYIDEIQRVLKPGKKCLSTFFILDEESEMSMSRNGMKNFPHAMGHFSLMDKSVKEANVAYRKDYIFKLLDDKGFEVAHFIRGNWSGMVPGELNEHQDILVFKKIRQ